MFRKIRSYMAAGFFLVAACMAHAAPLVTSTTISNVGGTGYDAIDFFYLSSPDAEFTNYHLDFGTSNGALIYDPNPGARQAVGGDVIDTFMNTVGSYLGESDAIHLQSVYKAGGAPSAPASADRIDWDVFDLLAGDTNSLNGNSAPYHMARVLVAPEAKWHASFTAYDTAAPGIGAAHNFTNDSEWVFPQPVVSPPVAPLPPDPVAPPVSPVVAPVVPPVAPPVTPPPVGLPPIAPPVSIFPPNLHATTTVDVGGSGMNAIDFYYSGSAGAEFTNYRLNFETSNGAHIYDPSPDQLQDAGSDAIDTFMNTVGSLLDVGNATHLHGEYDPRSSTAGGPISQIDWDVFDLLEGDTNEMGSGEPFHLARILVSPDAQWNASFTAYDTASAGIGGTLVATNDAQTMLPRPIVTPLPSEPCPIDPAPPVIEPPVVEPPKVDPPEYEPPVAETPPAEELPAGEPEIVVPPIDTLPRDGKLIFLPGIVSFPVIDEIGWIVNPIYNIDIATGIFVPWRSDGDASDFELEHFVFRSAEPYVGSGVALFTTAGGNVAAYDSGISSWLSYATSSGSGSVELGVPEPATGLLAALASSLLVAGTQRRRS
jgi:hypothetical protein